MKKTLHNLFDEAYANEIETLVAQNAASDVSADTLSAIKDKVYAKTNLKKEKKRTKSMYLRFGAIAACFVLILSAVAIVAMLHDWDNPPAVHNPPSISTMRPGSKITGLPALVYGDTSSEGEVMPDIIPPGFEIQTVIEAEIIEVLPDTYYYTDSHDSYYKPYHVAKLRVVDSIRGDGLPEEIFLRYSHYDTTVFEDYECFIMSLNQIGMENYALINGTQSRIDYFSNMFSLWVDDLGYGSVIAFNDGRVDDSFWDNTDYYTSKYFENYNYIDRLLDKTDPYYSYYPASRNSTIAEVKSNILALAKDENNQHVSPEIYNYVTVDDVFISDEAKEIMAYLEPSESNVFVYYLDLGVDRVVADYTRIVNGFIAGERITINGYSGENGNVKRRGEIYNEDDFAKLPNIGNALANMELFELVPPHIEITEEMLLVHANASGVYRKVDGKVYGIIRVMWCYKHPNKIAGSEPGYQCDDMYYLYDESGNGVIVERDELKAVIGQDSFIQSFRYEIYGAPII